MPYGLTSIKVGSEIVPVRNFGNATHLVVGLIPDLYYPLEVVYIPLDSESDLKNHPEFLEWVLNTDKNDHSEMVKENMKPFEILFFDVGAEILKNIGGYLAASPDKAIQKIRKDVVRAIKTVQKSKDIKKINTLKAQIEKLESIGGADAIVPSEGIVFKYQGKTYKFTGAFAPVNQITGLISF